MMLKSFIIEDDLDLQTTGAVEVIVELEEGQRRWCYCMTPQALAASGDWIDGTPVRLHYNAPYMIVIASPLDKTLIELALQHIDREGKLEVCTMPLDANEHDSDERSRI